MKLIRIAALLLGLLLLFTACASSNSKSPEAPAVTTREKTETEAPETEAPETEAPETEAPETEAPETEAPETEAPETEAPETEAPETEAPETEAPETEPDDDDRAVITGSLEGNVYTNEYLNLRCEATSGWTYYTEEEIAELNHFSSALLKDSDIKDWIEQNGQYTDLYLSDESGASINLVLQQVDPMMRMFTNEQLFSASESFVREQIEAAGFELTALEQVDVPFCGETVKALRIALSVYGFEVEEYQVWIRPEGDYMGILTVGGFDGTDVLPFLDMFSKLN